MANAFFTRLHPFHPMKKLSPMMIAALLASAFPLSAGHLYAGDDKASSAPQLTSGTRFANAPITRVAKAWERLVGGTVAVSDRAQARKVSMDLSPASNDELRKRFIAALRENGVYVIERAGGVLFDTEPAASSAK